jgi:hypothetical protein
MRPHAITALIVAALTAQGNIAAALPLAGPSNARGERLDGRTTISTLGERDPVQDSEIALQSRGTDLNTRAPTIPPPPEGMTNLAQWASNTGIIAAAVGAGGYVLRKGFLAFTSEQQRNAWAGKIASLLNAAHLRTQQYTASEIENDTSAVVEIVEHATSALPGA